MRFEDIDDFDGVYPEDRDRFPEAKPARLKALDQADDWKDVGGFEEEDPDAGKP